MKSTAYFPIFLIIGVRIVTENTEEEDYKKDYNANWQSKKIRYSLGGMLQIICNDNIIEKPFVENEQAKCRRQSEE